MSVIKMSKLSRILSLLIFVSTLFPSLLFSQEKRYFAILPVENLSPAESAWVSRGIEEILYDKFSDLHSISVFEKETLNRILQENNVSKQSDLTVRRAFSIGKETGTDVLIAAAYRVENRNLSLNVKVISTYTGGTIFDRAFQGDLADIYKINADAILSILSTMAIPASETEKALLNRASTNSIEAFENYCRAYTEFQQGAGMKVVAGFFSKAIQADPNFWEAQYNLGVIYYNFDQYGQALNQFNKVIQQNPSFYKPYYGKGIIFYLQGQFQKSIDAFNKALQINPNHDRTLYYLGRVFVRLDSLRRGLDYLEKAAEANPNYGPTQYYIGIANMKRGWYKTAVQAFRNTIRLDPENYLAHNALGESYYRLQRFDESIFEYQKAIALRKNYSTAYFNLGNTIYKKGALQEIVDSYLEILETRYTQPDASKDDQNLAFDLRRLRDGQSPGSSEVLKAMVNAYRNAIKYEPTFFEASFNLALTYENLGKPDSAEFYYRKSLDKRPDLVRAHMRLGRLLESEKRYQEALDHFKDVAAIEPSYFIGTPRLGEEYRYINIIEEVLKEYQQKKALDPNNPNTLLVLARIFSSLGRLGQAEQYYLQIVQLDPQNTEASRELRNLRHQMNKL